VGQPVPPPDDAWPTLEERPLEATRETVVDQAPIGAPPPPDRRIGAGMLLALGAVALVAVGILVAYLLTHRGDDQTTTVVVTAPAAPGAAKVSVPRVVGLDSTEAAGKLAQAGLRPKLVFRKGGGTNGKVLEQRPEQATRLAKGSPVTLIVASGAAKLSVPTVTGQSFTDARAKLEAAGLRPTRTEVTSDKPPGTVVDQAPDGGAKVNKGAVVTLSVARAQQTTTLATTTAATTTGATTTGATTTSPSTTTGSPSTPTPTSATMPDVSGQTEQAAVTAMIKAGLLASLAFVPAEDPLGTVEQQAKPEGTTLPYHAHVQVNISRGPGTKEDMAVPNAIGQTLTQAVATMNGAQLRLIYVKLPVTAKSQVGKIVQQSPLAAGKAPQNAQVLVYLGVSSTG
jgi:beta-lactam-binding protein with PASTA domain